MIDQERSYECVGGPLDGQVTTLHDGSELRIHIGPAPLGKRELTDEELARPIPERVGLYRLFRPKKKHLTYLKWMGEL